MHEVARHRLWVYRKWQYAPSAEPSLGQLGTYDVVGGQILTVPSWAQDGTPLGTTHGNKILSRQGDQMVLESAKLASGRRNLTRVPSFPGFSGAATSLTTPVQPLVRTPLDAGSPPSVIEKRGAIFCTALGEAMAAQGLTWNYGGGRHDTLLYTFRTLDSGGTWSDLPLGSYAGSAVRFKEQAHGMPLIFPIDTLSEYLHLWNQDLPGWEEDNGVQICRESAGFPDRDIVLRAAKGVSYSACILENTITIHRRVPGYPGVQMFAVTGDFKRVGAQWFKGNTEHGTLHVLGFIPTAAKQFVIYSFVESDEKPFPSGDPPEEIAVDCGAVPCAITDLYRYFVTGDGVHHIVALGKSDKLPAPGHPLAPESQLAVHVHGTPGGTFKTEVLNVRDGSFLGNLSDIDFPQGHQGEPDRLYATLQDDGCLRVLSSPSASIDWKPLGVVPTAYRPLVEAAVVWSDSRIGLLSRGAPEYLTIEILADLFRCPPPRSLN